MVCMFVINTLWAWYIKFINSGNSILSALTGEFIFLINAFVTFSYVYDPNLIIAATIGGFTGTYLAVRFTNKKYDKEYSKKTEEIT